MSFICTVNIVLTVQHYTVSENLVCILYVNMVLTIHCYTVSEIIAHGGLMFTVNPI